MHTEVTRHDMALGKIFDWKHAPAQDTYKRFFSKFTQATNHKVGDYFYSWIFDNIKFYNFTLDIDSSVMTRYGGQEGAKKGYNPAKRGRPSHHPLIAFIADVKLVDEISIVLSRLYVPPRISMETSLPLCVIDLGFRQS
jgi:hypothetical protein